MESLVMQRASDEGQSDYALAVHPVPHLFNFSLCYSIKPYRIHRVMVVVSYATATNDNEIRIEHTPETWRVLVYKKLNSLVHELVPYRGGGSLILGQDQDEVEGLFQREQAFTGEVAKIGMWTHPVSRGDLVKMTTMKEPYEGSIIPWPEGWKVKGNTTWRVIPSGEELVGGTENLLQFIGIPRSLEEHNELCYTLQGELGFPVSTGETETLMASASPWLSHCVGGSFVIFMWLGITDSGHEGIWKSFKGKSLNYTNWKQAEPNGGINENCVAVMGIGDGIGKWYDIMCDGTPLCAACRLRSRPRLRLRGICIKNQDIDHHYVLHPESHRGLYFTGFSNSDIKMIDAHHYGLVLQHIRSHIAVLKSDTLTVSPVGRHCWDVIQEEYCSDASVNSSVILVLSPCREDQFTCNSGMCVPLASRCDHQEDCADASDELNCTIVVFPPSYRQELPPPSVSTIREEDEYSQSFPDPSSHLYGQPEDTSPLSVYLFMDITDVTCLNSLDMELTLEFTLHLSWRDSRLTFNNLADDHNLNRVHLEIARSQWIPEVSFDNAQGNSHTLVDAETRIFVQRQGSPTISSHTHPFEA
ncbi:uncharacterized protein LOC135218617 [Macrobrachium nipponense]|uniref:uncharacterized protein LOC135218617 n=1 Tax=Macrobrachium nipponense TaxID=159736 RepID=UPI0030C81586